MSQNDTRLNLPAATLYQNLVDIVLSDGYSVTPPIGGWNQADFAEVLAKRTSPIWDVAWRVDRDTDTKNALFELEDAGYIIHLIYEIGGENVWFISLHGAKYHEVKKDSTVRIEQSDSRTGASCRIPATEMESFPSGAVRDTQTEKSRPDLVSPFAMDRLGQWLRLGAEKYNERNWEAGIPVSRCFASLYRHLLKYQEGDTSEDHLAAIYCNTMFILHFEEAVKRGLLPDSLLDMPKYERKGDEL